VTRVLVIHRDLAEAAERASRLRALGFDAAAYLSLGTRGFRGIRQDPPNAILIDLTRLPSYGKAMGVMLREQKSFRSIPLVFVEGVDKTAGCGRFCPWGVHSWAKVVEAVRGRFARRLEAAPPRDGPPLVTQLGMFWIADRHLQGFQLGVTMRKQWAMRM
jgi:hypothetical protein